MADPRATFLEPVGDSVCLWHIVIEQQKAAQDSIDQQRKRRGRGTMSRSCQTRPRHDGTRDQSTRIDSSDTGDNYGETHEVEAEVCSHLRAPFATTKEVGVTQNAHGERPHQLSDRPAPNRHHISEGHFGGGTNSHQEGRTARLIVT